jgi:hypothetical protein
MTEIVLLESKNFILVGLCLDSLTSAFPDHTFAVYPKPWRVTVRCERVGGVDEILSYAAGFHAGYSAK